MITYRWHMHNEEGKADFSCVYTVILVILAGLIFINSRFFQVKHVKVHNHRRILPEEILLSAGISRRQTLFQIHPKAIEHRILRNPAIAKAKVDLIFPDTVNITIKERIPLCLLPYRKGYVCVAKDGKVMGLTGTIDQYHIPLITGCAFKTPKPGERLKSERIGEAMELLSYTDRLLRKSLLSIDLNHFKLYVSKTGDEPIPVELGNLEQLERKMANLRAIIHQNQFNRMAGIDLRVPDIPTVVFK